MKSHTLAPTHKAVTFCLLMTLLCALCWSCAVGPDPNQKPGTKTTALTFFQDIKPILNRSCVGCHQAGGIGPRDLSTYEGVKPIAALIADQVKTRKMPPWQPSQGCQEYVGDSSLSDAEIKAIVDWAEAEAPEGDAANDRSEPVVEPVKLSRVDVTVKMKEPFDKYKVPDDYRCFVADWPLKEKAYVAGLQVNPGNLQVAHHVIVVVVGPSELEKLAKLEAEDPEPGYTCYGSPGQGLRIQNLGSWVPGAQQRDFPAGSGIPIEPGSKVIMQMHYNVLSSNPQPDQTSVGFKVEKDVDKIFTTIPLTNPQWVLGGEMKIPAGVSDATHSFTFDPNVGFIGRSFTNGKTVMLQTATVHMHQRGKSGRIWIKRKDGGETCVLEIPRWDFSWQGQYRFVKPIELQPGDQLGIECTFDNSAENQPLINGKRMMPQDLNWGEGTQDEMCLGAVTFLEK